MDWSAMVNLWRDIVAGSTPSWDEGKALEYLVVRGFELAGLHVEYPFDVPPGGRPIEQIDGLVRFDSVMFLLECKDKKKEDVEPISNLDHILKRRPQTTMGCLFVNGALTGPALYRLDNSSPHRILVWQQGDIENAVTNHKFKDILEEKYNILRKYGMFDHSDTYKELEDAE